jgi:hypothetical protein
MLIREKRTTMTAGSELGVARLAQPVLRLAVVVRELFRLLGEPLRVVDKLLDHFIARRVQWTALGRFAKPVLAVRHQACADRGLRSVATGGGPRRGQWASTPLTKRVNGSRTIVHVVEFCATARR